MEYQFDYFVQLLVHFYEHNAIRFDIDHHHLNFQLDIENQLIYHVEHQYVLLMDEYKF
jgi:hypothetical protein